MMKTARNKETRKALIGLAFVSPWLIHLSVFKIYPVIISLYYSFTDFIGINVAEWVGLRNYQAMFADPLFWLSIRNTLFYAAFTVVGILVFSIFLATVLSNDLKEISLWRSVVYFPSILPIFASSFIWMWVFQPHFGIINGFLLKLGIEGPGWYADPEWAKPTLILLKVWGAGNVVLIFLASINDISKELYEVASLDGAGWFRKFRHITLPSISPIILFNTIIITNQSLQVFTEAYIITDGGPSNSTLFYTLYLYQQAFMNSKMAQAMAMSWALLVFSLLLTMVLFKSTRGFVFYRGE